MPELPDIVVYIESLGSRVLGQSFDELRLASPFLLRSVTPPPKELVGRRVIGIDRLGKRIIVELDDELFIVLHLMIAGRLRWLEAKAKIPKRLGLAALDFTSGTLVITEASKKRRASLHLVSGRDGLAAFDRGGLEVLTATETEFRRVLATENHTLKRFLTDPRLLSGIGNAYSDEILHRARLSPLKWTSRLSDDEATRLRECCRTVLVEWTERLREEVGEGFPKKVTAFRPQMAVHGKYREPCPVCGTPVQRIVYSENECNYCPHCQTGDKLLADRALSQLLKKDWPRNLQELEEIKAGRGAAG